MTAIGRLDIALGLKRALELTGSFEPSLGEGLVPTVQVLDLDTTPFAVAEPWQVASEVAAGVALFSWSAIVPGAGLPANAVITMEYGSSPVDAALHHTLHGPAGRLPNSSEKISK